MERRRLFGTNGIRGVFNVELTPELALRIGMAAGTFFGGGEVFVGCDGRLSSPLLKSLVIGGLLATGCSIRDVGVAPTPVIQYAVRHHKPAGGVIVTASHNPPEFNGIKTLRSDGIETSRQDELVIEEIYLSQRFRRVNWTAIEEIQELGGIPEIYREAAKRHVDVDAIAHRRFKIVVDSGNGVGSLIYPQLFREVGCEVIEINSEVDGRFPARPPEPRPELLQDLSQAVLEQKADLGVAYDGDGDRAIFCDEKGIAYWGDKSAAILIEHAAREKGCKRVVTPVSSSQLIEEVARRCGAEVVWTRVGSIDVTYKMVEVGAVYGCEENGGCFYGPHQPVRDGGMTTLLVLEMMAFTGKSFSELIEGLPRYQVSKARIPCPNELKRAALDRLLKETEGYERITIDGVKVILPEGRVLMRPSGTEPIFRVYADAATQEEADRLCTWGRALVERCIEEARR